MEIGSSAGWVAVVAVFLFILAPIVWFRVFRKGRD